MFDSRDELLSAIQLGEDSSLELKALRYRVGKVESPSRNAIADEIAAMANSASGVIVFGVDDKTRHVAGIPSDKLDMVEEWIRNICNDLIVPQLYCRIQKLKVVNGDNNEKNIIRVDVPKSLFIHKSPGGYFLRIGSSKREMAPDVLARMFQQRSQARIIRFDEQIVPQAPMSCLMPSLYEKFRTRYSPVADEEFLAKLKLSAVSDDGVLHPTVSGVLLASRKPHEHLTNAFIQAVSYRGIERNADEQIDAMDITGPLDEQICKACFFVKKNMRVRATKCPARRDIPQYSLQAVFEAVVNAVAHRDYSIQASKIRLHMFADRLELFSPGAIPNTMTIESMPLRQSIRNELLTSLLARCPLGEDMEYIEDNFIMDRRGEGVPIILSKSERLSGKRPVYRLLDDSELMLTIFAAEPPIISEEL